MAHLRTGRIGVHGGIAQFTEDDVLHTTSPRPEYRKT